MDVSYLYKYRNLNDHSARILTQNEIYIPSPSEFNDPFDCRIFIRIEGSNEFYESELHHFLQRNRPDLDQSQISQITEYVIQTGVQRDPQLIEQAADLFLKTISKAVGVFCLTAKNDDILMWSHYANGHKGFCLKFRTDSHFKNAKEVKYQNEYPMLRYSGQQDFQWLNSLFLTKANHWNYEKEWRIIEMRGPGVYKFPQQDLCGIIFGCLMPQAEKNHILSLIKSRHQSMRLYQAMIKEKEFKLSILDINQS